MASEVKTNKISPATSTTINVGDSGDTLALATDAVTGFNVGSDAQGDILYHDGTDYTRLGAGTSGHFLKTQGTSANPVWAADSAGSLVYLASSRSTVNAATVDFQEFKSTDYLFYLITGFVKPVTDSVQFNVRLMDGASAITTSNYLFIRGGVDSDGTGVYANSKTNDNWTLGANVSTDAPVMFSLQLHFQDATDDGWDGALFNGNLGFLLSSTGDPLERTVYGNYGVDNANLDGIQFYHSSGDIDYHKIVVYGMKGS
jgi:hypothetical protein|tara:strand:- start:1272 stop:2045 length:774 start_codon:yes stop_codon:yes gene_type:complete